MTDAEVEALATAARAATPGEWYMANDDWIATIEPGAYIARCRGVSGQFEEMSVDENTKNRWHIVKSQPAAVLRLIARLRDAEADAARLEWLVKNRVQHGQFHHGLDFMFIGRDIRAAIDAAMKEQGA